MKTFISKFLFVICIELVQVNFSFGQQNTYDIDNDTAKASGTYYDVRISSKTNVNYLKHFLTAQLKVDQMGDSLYLNNFYNFLNSKNAILRNPEIDRFGLIDIRLSDTSDAINFVDIFYNSNLFEYVYPTPFGQQDGDPTDPQFEN